MSVSLDKLNLVRDESLPDAAAVEYATQPMAEAGKSSLGVLQLPSGYLDEAGSLHQEITIREIDGRDEDLLANQKIPVNNRISKMIENCILSIGPYNQSTVGWSDIVKSLPVIDRLWVLIQMRILSVGPIYSAKVQCPNEECRQFSQQNVDLNDFHVTPILNPEKRSYSGLLPKSQKAYVCKVMTGADEAKMFKMAQKNSEDYASLAIFARLLSLDGKPGPIAIGELKRLSLMDRQHLRNEFKKHEGEIDRSMECVCKYCETEFKQEIDFDHANFFFPSET